MGQAEGCQTGDCRLTEKGPSWRGMYDGAPDGCIAAFTEDEFQQTRADQKFHEPDAAPAGTVVVIRSGATAGETAICGRWNAPLGLWEDPSTRLINAEQCGLR